MPKSSGPSKKIYFIFSQKIYYSSSYDYSGKPLVVILSTILGEKIFSIFFFFSKFFFKYMALIIIIHIGHAENW